MLFWPFSRANATEAAPPRPSGSLSSLRPVEMEGIWGGCEVREGEPGVETHENLYYLPHVDLGSWGLFDAEDCIIDAAVDRKGPHDELLWQLPTSNKHYAEIAEEAPEPEYLYGGRFNGHFGHFLVECLPRYWSLPRWEGRRPKILWHSTIAAHDFDGFPFAKSIFAGLGLSSQDFVHFDRPMRVRRVIVPRPSLQQQAHAYRVFGRLCRAIGMQLMGGYAPRLNDRPAYLSKTRLTLGVGRIENEPEMEAVLARHGVAIIFPEELSFPDQVRLFASRTTILGTTSSAFHTSIFARPAGRLIQLSPGNFINSNMALFDRLNGNHAAYYYQPHSDLMDGSQFLRVARLRDPVAAAEDLLRLI